LKDLPPSTFNIWLVIKGAFSNKNSTALAISSGLPTFFSIVCSITFEELEEGYELPYNPRTEIVDLLNKYNYPTDETCLIGDSVNDYVAAKKNNIINRVEL
jgi:phosphoglycolate phosphatase-like HAD superfamily hydrolase